MAERGLTSRKITSRDFVKIFNSFDTDGNGYIEKKELDEFLKVMYEEKQGKPSPPELESFKQEVLSQYDENHDGRFQMQELQKILDVEESLLGKYKLKEGPITSVDFIKIWTHYDVDKSGFLEQDELEGFFYEMLQPYNQNVQPQQVKELVSSYIELYDSNKDGKFELSELARFIHVEDNFIEQFRGKSELSKEDFNKLFNHYDDDNSGEIEGDEITALLRDILLQQNKNQEITQADLEGIRTQILEMFDTNKDGKLSRDEMSLLFSCK
ncbi:calbindin-32-like isoform X2 [Actinia tenebrosa]|uniref:Calbindin-32-like isoform X2 n=1 Tax=Actinia tenebrosa TaxID=6105 RepID=A0A6P8IYV0_ACTTE|nr:calbindin-32-like isoform X2 [Actinia tenebrosa]